ncbi:hypothetical protein [Flavobacterium sp. J372]
MYVEFYNSKSYAIKRESYLKSGVGREFVKNLIANL